MLIASGVHRDIAALNGQVQFGDAGNCSRLLTWMVWPAIAARLIVCGVVSQAISMIWFSLEHTLAKADLVIRPPGCGWARRTRQSNDLGWWHRI